MSNQTKNDLLFLCLVVAGLIEVPIELYVKHLLGLS